MKRKVEKELNVQRLAVKIIHHQQAILRILSQYLNELDGITENLENLILESKVTCPRPMKRRNRNG